MGRKSRTVLYVVPLKELDATVYSEYIDNSIAASERDTYGRHG